MVLESTPAFNRRRRGHSAHASPLLLSLDGAALGKGDGKWTGGTGSGSAGPAVAGPACPEGGYQ